MVIAFFEYPPIFPLFQRSCYIIVRERFRFNADFCFSDLERGPKANSGTHVVCVMLLAIVLRPRFPISREIFHGRVNCIPRMKRRMKDDCFMQAYI